VVEDRRLLRAVAAKQPRSRFGRAGGATGAVERKRPDSIAELALNGAPGGDPTQ
jgi:hypothetical protein